MRFIELTLWNTKKKLLINLDAVRYFCPAESSTQITQIAMDSNLRSILVVESYERTMSNLRSGLLLFIKDLFFINPPAPQGL